MTAVGGAAFALPLRPRAQQKPMPVIGFLHSGLPGPAASLLAAFYQGLAGAEGQTVTIEYRWAKGHYDRLSALAAELADRKVDMIVAGGGIPSARAAKNATSTIPIVFTYGGDPVADGLVTSLAHPGDNLTGVSLLTVELNPKRLELLLELIPSASRVALFVNPKNPNAERTLSDVQDAARAKGVQLFVVRAGAEGEIDAAFGSVVERHASALVVGNDPFFFSRRERLVMLASRHALPAIYAWREFAASGGLTSYGPSQAVFYRPVGIYVGRILKGEKPADLPVQQPTTFELVINLKTAKALGLTVPPSILPRAGEAIE